MKKIAFTLVIVSVSVFVRPVTSSTFVRSNLAMLSVVSASLLVVVAGPAGAATGFSAWNAASGHARIEYRWKRSGDSDTDSCGLEFRDLDDGDRAYYKYTLYFVSSGDDKTSAPSSIKFFSAGEVVIGNTNAPCTRITDVLIRQE